MARRFTMFAIAAMTLALGACASVEVAQPRYATRIEDARYTPPSRPEIRSPVEVELATPRYASRRDGAAAAPAPRVEREAPPRPAPAREDPDRDPTIAMEPIPSDVQSEELPPVAERGLGDPRPQLDREERYEREPEARTDRARPAPVRFDQPVDEDEEETAAPPPPPARPSAPATTPAGPPPGVDNPDVEFWYVVQPGDTLAGIGRRFGSPVQRLIDLNGLTPQGGVKAGQRIGLPQGARDRGVDPFATGQEIIIRTRPKAEAPRETRAAAEPPRPAITALSASPGAATAKGRGKFIWPVRGEILSAFGTVGTGIRNDGIDIAAPAGTPVKAAADGDVVYAGSAIPGFGNLVLIRHSDGWVSAYGHLGSIAVKMRQRVRQGETIGVVGDSGGAPNPRLHFELRYSADGRDRATPVDPRPILP